MGQIPQSHFRAACDGFGGSLKAIIRSKGSQFEQIKLILKFNVISNIVLLLNNKIKTK